MNRDYVLFNLREARDELERTLRDIETNPDYGHAELWSPWGISTTTSIQRGTLEIRRRKRQLNVRSRTLIGGARFQALMSSTSHERGARTIAVRVYVDDLLQTACGR
jgi:hypothetical protein